MAVTMSHRFDQDKTTLRAIVRSGKLGKVNTVSCRYRVGAGLRRDRKQPVGRHDSDCRSDRREALTASATIPCDLSTRAIFARFGMALN